MLKVGRWLEAEHPEAADPVAWTRQTCAAWIAALDRMNVGDYVQRTAGLGTASASRWRRPPRQPSSAQCVHSSGTARSRSGCPGALTRSARWGTPRSIAALLGPDPRDRRRGLGKADVAGINLQAADLPQTQPGNFYPVELVRAVTLTWLFSGQRSDEIARLRSGCIRWQHDGAAIAGDSQQILARDAVCLLDVPAHKTGTAFTKPVDPILGPGPRRLAGAIRPGQPKFTDRRTVLITRARLAFALRWSARRRRH